MSTGSAAIPQLKAAPEPEQLAERLEGGAWRGLEICLAPRHVATDDATARELVKLAIDTTCLDQASRVDEF